MQLPEVQIPIVEIKLDAEVQLFMKREDLIHPEISGNKYWKLFYTIKNYLSENKPELRLITFGGAFSNHISAVAALGKDLNIPTMGIIRGEELENKWQRNDTLVRANANGMSFRFVSRELYRNKISLSEQLQLEFPDALIIPEGGTNKTALEGVQHMLDERTKSFDYLCTTVGTGGTIAGISKFAAEGQKVLGFTAVNDSSLTEVVAKLSGRQNFELIEAHGGAYGKITDENIRFINEFYQKFNIPLEPVYTSKMMLNIFELIQNNYFPKGSKILAFHTGGLQGVQGANRLLASQHRPQIQYHTFTK